MGINKVGTSNGAPTNVLRLYILFHLGIIFRNGMVYGHMIGTNPFHRVETLDPQGKYILEWEVDHSAKRVTFNVTVATRGYVGFGLSDNGKMSGADIMIGGVLPNGKSYFTDRHAVANQLPEIDESQDWDLHEARENKTHTFLSFSRAFDTCDPQDYVLAVDKVSIIWAFGEKDDNLEYHYRNRGEYPVHLLNPDYTPYIERDPKTGSPVIIHSPYNEDVKVWSWQVNYTMPTDHTIYWCTMNKGPVLSRKHHMIGFEMRFSDEISRRHLHHIQVSRCHAPPGFNDRSMFHPYLGQGQLCFAAGGRSAGVQQFSGPIPVEYCGDAFPGSAIGNRIHFYPPHVGIPIGDNPDEYFVIQVHYDNPEQRPRINVDVSLDVFYTPHLRDHDGDVIGIRHESPGLPLSRLIPPSSTAHKSHAICGSDCTRKMFPEEGIRIHSVMLHAHNSAVGIRLRHFRGNNELPFIAAEDNYSFSYQQMRVLPEEVHVLPGDEIMAECVVDTTWTNGTVVEGFSTRQEMCLVGVMYYNRFPYYSLCASGIDSPENREHFLGIQNISWSNQHLEYVVQSPRRFAGLPVTQVSDMIDWTLAKREELQRFQLTHKQSNICPPELSARRHTVNENGEPMDLEPELSLPTIVQLPKPIVPYSRFPSCAVSGRSNYDGNNERDFDRNQRQSYSRFEHDGKYGGHSASENSWR